MKLWDVLVGSHAFGVSHPGSDYDYFSCYIADSADILSGRVHIGGTNGGCHVSEGVATDGKKFDRQNHELWRWVDGAMNENLNYMIGLFSPLPVEDRYGFLAELRTLVSKNRTTSIVASTLGMARSNLRKMEMHNTSGDEARAIKNLRTSIRAIWFAERFIEGAQGAELFHNAPYVKNIPTGGLLSTLKDEVEILEERADRSSLPSHPDAEPFHEFQLRVRMACYSLTRNAPGGK